MSSERLALALRELQSGDWLVFEKFAAAFLAVDYPSLRTMASPAGDKGRDGQLYVVDEAPKTMVQYSVAEDWRAKILGTEKRLNENFKGFTRLIYCTSQVIGPAADSLVEEFRNRGISLDIRDRSWFVDRQYTAAQREIASEDLSVLKVDPLLSRHGIANISGPMMSDDDARVALFHLSLEGYDENSDRNITKSCFEALLLAALHDTNVDSPIGMDELQVAVKALVPVDAVAQVEAQISGAASRLTRKGGPVKFIAKENKYHLSFEQHQRNVVAAQEFATRQRHIEDDFAAAIQSLDIGIEDARCKDLGINLRAGIEEILFRKGEAFARAVAGGVMVQVDGEAVMTYLTEAGHDVRPLTISDAKDVIFSVLDSPSEDTQKHLGRLADGYTLFAFLRQTADVQKIMLEVFSGGEIWLDASVVLPLLEETLIDDLAKRHYTTLLGSALDAGFKLYVTDGTVEEIERHLYRAQLCARTAPADWRSDVPFIYAAYTLSGRPRNEFFDWLSEFRGQNSPLEDIEEYLRDEFRIELRSLLEEANAAPTELRGAVQEIWAGEMDRKRSDGETPPEVISRLVAHDVEVAVGVIQLRKATQRSGTGYRQWWLTFDRTAFDLKARLAERMVGAAPQSPALSPDFLSQLLRLGPLRAAIETEKHVALPVITSISTYESIPSSLLEVADSTRKRFEGQNERTVRRLVKDKLNELRWRVGVEARSGVRGAEKRIRGRLRDQAAAGGAEE
ncbi:hypothetical protein [Kribbella catacumbae]|uniref:hypothetical protein n=1 Tax=Kribbella catacumbae TaxID=460086 RepID=UPI0012FB009D|nr:hypothetical protein [Kribbella catacumbae]